MSKKIQVVPAEDVRETARKRKSPAQLILEGLEGDYMIMREMADAVGVHIETLRRLCRAVDDHGNKKINAPSQAVKAGEMVIYLFDKKDQEEVKDYFRKKGYVIDT